MYDSGRYWTVTGHVLDGFPRDVMPRAEQLRALHAELLGEHHKDSAEPSDNRALALSALAGLSARRADGYADWLAVGMALHSVDSSAAMLEAWDHWSRLAPDRYEEGACARKWKSFGRRDGWTIGSVIHWAEHDGWVNPRKTADKSTQGGSSGKHVEETGPTPDVAVEQILHGQMDVLRQNKALARAFYKILRDSGDE